MHGRSALVGALIALVAMPSAAAAFAPGTTTLLDRPSGTGALPASPFTDQPGRLTAATTPNGRYTVFVSGADGLSTSDDNRSIGIWRRDRTTNTTLLVAAIGVSGGFDPVAISDDGSRVAFISSLAHVAGDTDEASDVYVRDIAADVPGAFTLASPGGGASDPMFNPVLSGDGAHVAFQTLASLLPADTQAFFDVYRFTVASSTLELVSRTDGGTVGNGSSSSPDISGNGDFVVFHTTATNLDVTDTNGTADVMRRQISTADTRIVSTLNGSATDEGNGLSAGQSISADGDEIAFGSGATNLVAGPVSSNDVYRKRMTTNETILVSRGDGAAGAVFTSFDTAPVISPDGAAVAWATSTFPNPSEVHVRRGLDGGDPQTDLVSRTPGLSGVTADGANLAYSVTDTGVTTWVTTARNLPAGDVDFEDLYLTDVAADTLEPLMRPTGAPDVPFPASQGSSELDEDGIRTVSADGRFVVFRSQSNALSPDDDNRVTNVFVRDTLNGTTTLASRAGGAGGAGANASGFHAVISGDGRRVAWETTATNLGGPAVPGTQTHVFVRDLDTSETLLADRVDGSAGAAANAGSFEAALDGDGSRIAFATSATNLGNGDTDALFDIHVRDTDTGQTLLASRADGASGAKSNGPADDPYLDASGNRVVFDTGASNLGDGDTDAGFDVHVRDLAAGRTLWASRPDGTGAAQSDGFSGDASISADGNRVAFFAGTTNFGNGDSDDILDIHVRDLAAGVTVLVSRASGPGGAKGDSSSSDAVVSASGTAVAFASAATNLVAGDVNQATDVFLRRLDTNETTLVSRGDGVNGPPISQPPDGFSASSGAPGPNGDGSCVAFETLGAPELLPAGASSDFSHVLLRVLRRECPLPPIQTTIDGATVSGSTATLTFSASAAGASFLCRVDGGAFAPCSSGVQFGGLSAGDHTFEVKAVDAATFEDASPATRTVTVVAPAGNGDQTPTQTPAPTPTPTPTPPPAPPVNRPAPRPPVTTPPALVASRVLKLPSACTSRRRFRIKLALPAGASVRTVAVTINGKRAKSTRRGADVDLRGLPKGRIAVKITVTLADGRSVTTTKRYRTCAPRKRRT